jgi:hypothetical protein
MLQMVVPANPKIYHIVHVDRLASILADGGLLSDAQVVAKGATGTTIGMTTIKQRRLNELQLSSHPGLYVGQCVPFYFCPRSIMLYLIAQANHEDLVYRGGQEPIIHLLADMRKTVAWADLQKYRWAFTLSNAGSYYFEDRRDLRNLNELNWDAIKTHQWQSCKEHKQAEFLVEESFPWHLVEGIGVYSKPVYQQVKAILAEAGQGAVPVKIKSDWYY